jgi:hypothetical protein
VAAIFPNCAMTSASQVPGRLAISGHLNDNSLSEGKAYCWTDLLCLGVLLMVWLVVSVPRLGGPIDLRWDASTYYVLGTALNEGKGYRLLNEPAEIKAVQYPPLLPLMVAAHQWAMATNDYVTVGSALRSSYFILSGCYLLVIYFLAREILPPLYSFIVGLATVLSFCSFLFPSDALYADLPFSLLFALFLVFERRGEKPSNGAIAGLIATAAYLLRTAGIILLVAWVGASLVRRQFRQTAIRIAVSAIPILLWQGYIARTVNSTEYQKPSFPYQRASYYYPNVTYSENSSLLDPFRPELGKTELRQMASRIGRNLLAIPVSLGESAVVPISYWRHFVEGSHPRLNAVLPTGWPSLSLHALSWSLTVAGLLALLGAFFVVLEGEWLLAIVFGITIAVVILAPWQDQFWRYLGPVAPLTLIFLLWTMLRIRHRIERQNRRWGSLGRGLMGIILVGGLLNQTAVASGLLFNLPSVTYFDAGGKEHRSQVLAYGRDWEALDRAFEWIRRNAKEGAIVATAVPQLGYLRSGHKTVLPPFDPDPTRANQLLDEVPVSYLVLDNFGPSPGITDRYAAPVVTRIPENWRVVFTAPDNKTKVYERVR